MIEDESPAYEHRRSGRLLRAGDEYSIEAYERFAQGELVDTTGRDLQYLLYAATCYRIGGRMDRCRNRCQMGVLRAEDVRDRQREEDPVDQDDPQLARAYRGVWDEFIGDFRIVGDLNGVDDAYEAAFDVYRRAGDPSYDFCEPPYAYLDDYIRNVARGAGGESAVEEFYEYNEWVSFSTRAQYKRETLPKYVETLVERGEWGNHEGPE